MVLCDSDNHKSAKKEHIWPIKGFSSKDSFFKRFYQEAPYYYTLLNIFPTPNCCSHILRENQCTVCNLGRGWKPQHRLIHEYRLNDKLLQGRVAIFGYFAPPLLLPANSGFRDASALPDKLKDFTDILTQPDRSQWADNWLYVRKSHTGQFCS